MSDGSVIAIIGGSGIYNLDGIKIVNEHIVETPFGSPSGHIIEAKIGGVGVYFLPRHGRNHSLLPSEINYRANIFALKQLGVKYVVSVSAVGSLKEDLAPTMFVLPDQFIDWTKGSRERSFFGDGIVGHVSVAEPVEESLQQVVAKSCEQVGIDYRKGGSYICIEGPQFSTKAESAIYRSFGASVIGMTNVPESYLAKEAGLAYATVAMVTDYDCWKEEHCTVEEILKVMKINNEKAHKLVVDLVPMIGKNPPAFETANKNALMTSDDKLKSSQKKMLETLLG